MGLFGGSDSLNLGTGGDYGSKLRSSSTELDLSSDPADSSFGAASTLDLAGGDFQKSLQIEQQKGELLNQIRNLTDICWDTCVTGSLGGSLGGRTETCLQNCAGRFVDATVFITQRFAEKNNLK